MTTPEPQPAESKPKFRWYQFSLRTLLIVVWLLGPMLGWIGRPIYDRITREASHRAARAILLKDLKEAVATCPPVEDANTPEAIFQFLKKAFRERTAESSQPHSPPLSDRAGNRPPIRGTAEQQP